MNADDSERRSDSEKPDWIKLSCQRCKKDFWSVPAQAAYTLFCSDGCRNEAPEVRFWKSVTKDGPMHPSKPELGCCWNSKFTPSAPYPSMKINGKTIRAVRFILELSLGRPIKEGLYVLHSCDNTRCVNPQHLREGTTQDNVDERQERKRSKVGEDHGQAKLTAEQVREIRALKGTSLLREVAEQFNVCIHTIWCIWQGRTWKDTP